MKNEVLVVKTIEDVLEKKFYLRKDSNGHYEGEIYTDYNDTMEDSTIKEILDEKNPKERYNELILEWYEDSQTALENEYVDAIEKELNEKDIDFDSDEVREYVYDNVGIKYPFDHFLGEDVCANLILDVGDGNYDYSINGGYQCFDDETIDDESVLVWMANQQGYTKKQLEDAVFRGECHESKFLKSLVVEIENATSHMNAFTFFIKSDLETMMNMSGSLKSDDVELVVKKDSNCGLVDFWSGAGSILEVVLEKDVVIPKKYIDSFKIDGARGYGVDRIYGMCCDFWNGNVIIKEKQ